MKGVSASKAGLLPLCQYPFRDGTPWEETKSVAADKGNLFHAAVAGIVDPEIQVTSLKGTEWLLKRLTKASAWLDAQAFPSPPVAEIAFAFDWSTGTSRVLGKNIGRKYRQHGKTDDEIAGSADFLVVHDGTVTVYDWKTGKAVTESVWPQMEWLGLFAARAYGATRAVLRPIHVTDFGIEDGLVRELDASGLARVAESIRRDVAAIPDSWPEPGPHCEDQWCPARKHCALYNQRKTA